MQSMRRDYKIPASTRGVVYTSQTIVQQYQLVRIKISSCTQPFRLVFEPRPENTKAYDDVVVSPLKGMCTLCLPSLELNFRSFEVLWLTCRRSPARGAMDLFEKQPRVFCDCAGSFFEVNLVPGPRKRD